MMTITGRKTQSVFWSFAMGKHYTANRHFAKRTQILRQINRRHGHDLAIPARQSG